MLGRREFALAQVPVIPIARKLFAFWVHLANILPRSSGSSVCQTDGEAGQEGQEPAVTPYREAIELTNRSEFS